MGDTPFTVIGVMKPKLQNSSYQQRDKDRIFIPSTTHYALYGRRFLNNIVYRAKSSELTKVAEKRVYETLGRKYRFDPTDEDALGVWDTSEWETRFGAMFVAFNAFFGIVGTFTLLVGGIGVANIMYIVVRERTREIGIRRAVGATRRDILIQFFVETCLIVGIGAVCGMLLSRRLGEGDGEPADQGCGRQPGDLAARHGGSPSCCSPWWPSWRACSRLARPRAWTRSKRCGPDRCFASCWKSFSAT